MGAFTIVNCVFCQGFRPGMQPPGIPVRKCEVCDGRVEIALLGRCPLKPCHFCRGFRPGMQPPGIPVRRCSVCNGSGYLTADGKAPIIYTVEAANVAIKMNKTVEAAVRAAFEAPRQAPAVQTDRIERQILEKLNAILPSTAASYNQAIVDLRDSARPSMRGTAMELREVLREVLDHLAPDVNVQGAPGFKFEPGQSKPTMRQKAHFILKAREHPSSTAKAPEEAVAIAEELIAAFVRSIYQVGSVAGHVSSAHPRVSHLKQYVDVALAELLNIG